MPTAALASPIARPAESVIAEAVAQIMSAGAASRSLSARIAADSRIVWLTAELNALALEPLPGMDGARQWVREHGSARAARRSRINALLVARENQLQGNRPGVRWWLRSAQAARAAEVLRRLGAEADLALFKLDRTLHGLAI